jgi:anti-sigma factor RsiW
MKACSKNRKLLAWLALGELDARRAGELRAHIQTCDGCRYYLEEVSAVTDRLAAVDMTADMQASESFHGRLVTSLRAEQPISLWASLVAQVTAKRMTWRVALPVFGTAPLVIVILSVLVRQPTVPLPTPTVVQAVSAPALKSDPPPTIANYQRAATRSLDELDALLARQAKRNLPPAPIYTASMSALASVSD